MKIGQLNIKINKIILLLIISILFVYVWFRAYSLSFTIDECLSLSIVKGDLLLAKTANNHYLNTWLMSVSYYLFGDKEIYLRLPNILAFTIYSYFTYKILKQTNNISLLLLGVCLLLFNPYLYDFFCTARGYGLSLGFGIASLYFLLKKDQVLTYKLFLSNLSASLFFSLLSAYSNMIDRKSVV